MINWSACTSNEEQVLSLTFITIPLYSNENAVWLECAIEIKVDRYNWWFDGEADREKMAHICANSKREPRNYFFSSSFFCGRRRRRRRRWVVCVRRIRLIDTHFFAHAIICRLSYWLLEFIRRRLHCLVREFKKKSPRTTPERISHIFVNWHD